MCDLTDYNNLPSAELEAEFRRMFGTLSTPATASTSRDVPEAPPLGRAVTGEPITHGEIA